MQIEILGDASSLERAFGRSQRSASGFEAGLKKASLVAAGALGAIGVAAKLGFGELAEGQKVAAQTGAVLEATGGVANVTAKQVDQLAGSISAMSGVDDELIQSGENLLLTFKNVRNEIGQGNRVFDRATQAAVDLSVAGFGSVESSSKMLGKALNDPLKGLSALTRAGVTFSEEQKKAIKAMVDTGDVLGAQKTILREVESQVGGSAKAYGETLPGQLAKTKNALAETAASFTEALLPAITAGASALNGLTSFMQEHETATKGVIGAIAALSGIVLATNAALKAYAALQVALKAATAAWTAAQWLLNAALTANPIGVVVVALAALGVGLVAAWKHSETFRAVVTGAFNAVKGAALAVLDFFRDHWKTIAVLISGPFAPLVALATDAFGIRSAMIRAFGEIRDSVAGALGHIRDLFVWFKENAGRMWSTVQRALTGPMAAITATFQALADVLGKVLFFMQQIVSWVDDFLDAIGKVGSAVGKVGGFIGKITPGQHGIRNFGGGLALVGEAGPELLQLPRGSNVIPLGGTFPLGESTTIRRSAEPMAGAGMVVNQYFSFPNYVGSRRELIDEVRRGLYDVSRLNPGALPGVA